MMTDEQAKEVRMDKAASFIAEFEKCRLELRDESLQAPDHAGLYPCGEGAGYAGGIMSAAIDGLRVAEAIMAEYKSLKMKN